ncbi:hypothetical protein GCK32_014546 [Trichostrongylus colubriformis]|uniref:Uncharacterized protein n=1 Tax=Trichostrongylus colubriformis TaxID=6319 RepID=A0AAN8IXB9_TRICO
MLRYHQGEPGHVVKRKTKEAADHLQGPFLVRFCWWLARISRLDIATKKKRQRTRYLSFAITATAMSNIHQFRANSLKTTEIVFASLPTNFA